jgi:hypothetical protein
MCSSERTFSRRRISLPCKASTNVARPSQVAPAYLDEADSQTERDERPEKATP